jgi:hypothetical protein
MQLKEAKAAINAQIVDELGTLPHNKVISETKINDFKRFLKPAPKKLANGYLDYLPDHIFVLVYAWKLIAFQDIRTSKAFEKAYLELKNPQTKLKVG